jgi:Transposase DDE domain
MLLGSVFERFVAESPVSVMARGVLEHGLAPEPLDRLFEATAHKQYTKGLLFSTLVDLMGLVVCRVRPSVHAAYQARAEQFRVSLKAVYAKLERLEPGISAALVRHTAAQWGPLIEAMGAELPALLPGYQVKILDGNHLAGTGHRLQELRGTKAGALPGQALVALDPARMLVVDIFPDEDGHAQERASLPGVLGSVRPGDLWVADRNFCTTDFLFGIAARQACFLIRQHQATLHWQGLGEPCCLGRIETGTVYARAGWLTDAAGQEMQIRRITVVLDQPTRDGDSEIHLLSNVPPEDASACTLATLYRKRWTLETAFQELTVHLACEVNTLGYPKAALFGFCVAVAAYNALAVVKAALRSVHGAAKVQQEVSSYYLAEEVSGTYRGMMIAIPAAEWEVFRELPVPQLAALLKGLAGRVRLAAFRKHPRGAKKPPPQRHSDPKHKHVSTARILAKRKKHS